MKKLVQDFEELMGDVKEIPEIAEYLTSFSVIIGDTILARRIQLNWTQTQLAEKAGTTQARISQIEAAHEGIKMETINKVFKALGLVDIDPNYREDAVGKIICRHLMLEKGPLGPFFTFFHRLARYAALRVSARLNFL